MHQFRIIARSAETWQSHAGTPVSRRRARRLGVPPQAPTLVIAIRQRRRGNLLRTSPLLMSVRKRVFVFGEKIVESFAKVVAKRLTFCGRKSTALSLLLIGISTYAYNFRHVVVSKTMIGLLTKQIRVHQTYSPLFFCWRSANHSDNISAFRQLVKPFYKKT